MRKKIILVEFHGWKPELIRHKILVKALKFKFGSDINVEAFATYPHYFFENFFKKLINNLKIYFGFLFSLKTFGIFKKEMKVNKIFYPNINSKHIYKSKIFYKKFCKKKISKKTIANLKINGVFVGDILIDSYLRNYYKPFIDVKDQQFLNFINSFFSLFFYWEDYFNKNDIKAVIAVHPTYMTGLPARIAIYKNIKSLITRGDKLFQLTKKNIRPSLHFKNYKRDFKKFNDDFKKKAISDANLEMQKKFGGSKKYEHYILKSPFSKKKTTKRVIKKSKKFKIIIFPLSFFDSPTGYGGALFHDFYEWLVFVLKLSSKTNYDWYIKLHPDVLLKWDYLNYSIVKNLLKKYKNVNWIAPETPHNQIIKEGINAALTIHGTVGSEYPYYNIPVVNASINNPHMNYGFNFNPKSKKELKRVILTLPKLKIKIKIKEILEFFFMHHMLPKYNWLEIDTTEILKKTRDLKDYYSNMNTYDLISQNIKENNILKSLRFFLNTDDYVLGRKYDKKTNYKNIGLEKLQ